MMFRLFLGLLLLFALYRFLRRLAQTLGGPRPEPRQKVHKRPRRGRNPIEGARVIDVEYSEKKEREGKDDA